MGLPATTTRPEIIRKFRSLGFEGPLAGGSHPFMKKGPLKVHIPNPHESKDVHVSLLSRILKQAGISDEDWNAA